MRKTDYSITKGMKKILIVSFLLTIFLTNTEAKILDRNNKNTSNYTLSAITGKITDATSARPVLDAFVVATWRVASNNTFQSAQESKYVIQQTTANADGSFTLPERAVFLPSKLQWADIDPLIISVFQTGYHNYILNVNSATDADKIEKLDIKLTAITNTFYQYRASDEWLKELLGWKSFIINMYEKNYYSRDMAKEQLWHLITKLDDNCTDNSVNKPQLTSACIELESALGEYVANYRRSKPKIRKKKQLDKLDRLFGETDEIEPIHIILEGSNYITAIKLDELPSREGTK